MAEEQAKSLCSDKKVVLASDLYTVTVARGCGGDIRFVKMKDISHAYGRGKKGTGIMCSASPDPARKENQEITLTPI